MNDLISVIVPVFKAANYIEKCAQTLLEQTYDNIEYLFVNDCTPDNSIEILEALIKRYPNRKDSVKIINFVENKGHATARNVALKQCTGAYIIQIDSDDWVEHDMIEKLYLKAISEHSDMVCCEYIAERNDFCEHVAYPFKDDGKHRIKEFYLTLLYSAHWNKLVKRELIVDNEIYCIEGTNNLVDIGQTLKLRFLAKKISILKEPLYHYNMLNSNSQSARTTPKRIKDFCYIAKNLSDFLDEYGKDEFRVVSNYIKFWSKQGLLTSEYRDYHDWVELYPESHKYIWKYKPYPLMNRIFYYLASKRIFWFFSAGKRIQTIIRAGI